MSSKTKLYIAPGVTLDWENENHRRAIEEDAYAEFDRHPKPTMASPERSRWWWFWRAFGMFVYVPARRAIQAFMRYRYVPEDYVRRQPAHKVYDWPFGRALHEWIERGPQKGHRAFWLRAVLYWITTIYTYDQCLHCGFTELYDEFTIYDGPDDTEGRTIDMFEHVDGGGVDYWGEAEDAHGWMWCYRCGSVSWEAV